MDKIGPGATHVLLALLRVQARDGRVTTQSVATEAGRALSTTHCALKILQREGLVTREPGLSASLRAPLAIRVGDSHG